MGCTHSIPNVEDPLMHDAAMPPERPILRNSPALKASLVSRVRSLPLSGNFYDEKKEAADEKSARSKPSKSRSQEDIEDRIHPFNKPLDVVRDEMSEVQQLARCTHFDEATIQNLHEIFEMISSSQVFAFPYEFSSFFHFGFFCLIFFFLDDFFCSFAFAPTAFR